MRDNRIDVLRFIGLAMIIFAHVGPPRILFQLRNFDVPLMVLVSGMSFGLSYKSSDPYSKYLWKRIKRLVFPVWIFLTIYFVSLSVFYPQNSELNIRTIITSYTLVSGIGYVWIIRVFLLVALVSPFIFTFNNKINSHRNYLMILIFCILSYELFRYISLPYIQQGFGYAVSLFLHYLYSYAIVFTMGLRMTSLDKKQVLHISIYSFIILISIGFGLYIANGKIILTQQYKYPPSIYYNSYAIFVSSFLWYFSRTIVLFLEKVKIIDTVLFMAQNSIWIYLWHIPLVKTIHANFVLKYLAAILIASAVTYLQVWIINNLIINHVSNDKLRKNIKILFTG